MRLRFSEQAMAVETAAPFNVVLKARVFGVEPYVGVASVLSQSTSQALE
jgi:hypothetical protein